jgi:hypothetical protein
MRLFRCLALTIFMLPCVAFAQDSNIILSAPGLMPKKPPPSMPEVKRAASVWPRLERGALLCKTDADLRRYAAQHRGERVDGPAACQRLHDTTAISVLQRAGLGMTQVRTTDPAAGGVGWTDSYLPEKEPR